MDWSKFNLLSIINEDTKSKHLALHLQHIDTCDNGVVLLNKLPFNPAESFNRLVDGLVAVDSNDIYHRFINEPAGIECKLIYPATPSHINKYSQQSRRLILETPALHSLVTRPHFEMLRESGQTAWIQNILDDKSEMERRLIDNKIEADCDSGRGFVLLPDYKWTDESNISGLYLLAIPRRNDLWSVRDLDGDCLPLLNDIRDGIKSLFPTSSTTDFKAKYKYPDGTAVLYNHLRIYFHYPPTYSHLHIHITHASSQSSCAAGQAILLDEVIDNLENVSSDYYKCKRSIPMEFGDQNELFLKLNSAINK